MTKNLNIENIKSLKSAQENNNPIIYKGAKYSNCNIHHLQIYADGY